ncbi:MAG: response regulator [Atopobiaceae bacterium]|nr:response regulator [Atopobiaceae bacterium]
MRAIAVDDKKMPLEALVEAIQEAEPGIELTSFRNPLDVLAWDGVGDVDVAFVDIDMPVMSGIQLAQELKMRNAKVNVIFATGYHEFAGDAMMMHASGYLMKPITAEKVRHELDDLRHPVEANPTKRLFVKCFGNFEAFVDGKPLDFSRSRTRELFAYLIDRRGSIVSNSEIEAVLWEDEATESGVHSYLRTLTSDLRRSLESLGLDNVLIKRRGALGVDPTSFDCDFYQFLEGVPSAVNAYHGEYMSQYSWAEMTLAQLEMRR